jgi:transcriptional regulator with XRE-family HTH domain
MIAMDSESVLSSLAYAVRAARLANGWSKEEAARRAGVSSITWKRVEDDLPVQEHKLNAIGEALGWGPGRAFQLKGQRQLELPDVHAFVRDGGGDLAGAGVTNEDLFRELVALREEVNALKRKVEAP